MALPPRFAGQRLAIGPSATSVQPHTLELYLDYVCPFSAKLFRTVYEDVAPALRETSTSKNGVDIIIRQQVQPWHPSSTLTHEAALAVLKIAPEKFYEFSAALFREQKSYFDVSVVNETRNATYGRLAKLAGTVGVDESKVLELLTVSDKPGADGSLNSGNGVTTDLKVVVKMARLTGVHVSPTVLFDGVVVNEISSGWTKEQWFEWLGKNVS